MQPNSIAFIALCNEFCSALESVATGSDPDLSSRAEFVASMLNFIPRLYISATDLRPLHIEPASPDDEGYEGATYYDEYDAPGDDTSWAIEDHLDEDYYDSIRRSIEAIMGKDDVYLEVFEEDMKYSDTPISASISEGLADIFQSLYNFIETIRDASSERIAAALEAVKEDFEHFWSRPACNLLRALNHVRYFALPDEEE